jgi:adenosylhomocysteine nucleosidase
MKIGILTAMSVEFRQVAAMLCETESIQHGPQQYLTGTLGRNQIVLLQCGIGKVNAAMGVTDLILHFQPDCIISTGVAGGIDTCLRVMDVVVGRATCYHDVWCGFDGVTPRGQVQGLPLYFDGAAAVIEKIEERPGLHCGLIVSGDQFIDTAEQVESIKSLFPAALAVDMESGAIAQACYLRGVPFVSMRIISDSPGAGHDNTTQYNDFWTDAPQHTLAVVRELLEKL